MDERAPKEIPPLATRLVTERLVLRAPRTTDVPELRRLLRANAVHLRPWSAAPAPGEDPTSLTAVSRSVLRHRREWKRGQAFVFLVTTREDGQPGTSAENAPHPGGVIGRIALGGVLRGAFQNAYLGYWIDVAKQGLGLMPEAVRAATTFAFHRVGLHRVQAAVMPRNGRSMRVLEKVGYRREGLALRYLSIAGAWEDHVLFAVTAEEWENEA
jgi:ribosomal-protein-alanine N-acetyltransferase